jgi:hypothetical protein
MDPGTRRVFALALAAIVVLAGAVALFSEGSQPPAAGGPPGTIDAVGVIVAVDAAGLGDVRGFTLRQAGGAQLTFDLRSLENGAQFPPGHLAEHQATAEPIRVWYRLDGTDRLAIRLEDAPR